MAVERPFTRSQDRTIDFALSRPNSGLFLRPGKGKTLIGAELIDTCLYNFPSKRVLVFAPKFPMFNAWPQEFEKWGYDFDYRILHGKEKRIGKEQVTIINYDAMQWFAQNADLTDYAMVLYDELHYMKAPGSRRARSWRAKADHDFEFSIGMTGTPAGASLEDLYGQLRILDNGASLGRTRYMFEREYLWYDRFRETFDLQPDAPERMFEALKSTCIACDFLPGEVPGITHHEVLLDMPVAAREAYETLKKKRIFDGVVADTARTLSNKLRQMTAGQVYDAGGAIVKLHNVKAEYVEKIEGNTIVFYEFNHSLDRLKEVYPDAPVINGATPDSVRVGIVKDWNEGRHSRVLSNIKAGGVGGNMQGGGSNVAFYDVPWPIHQHEQGYGRVWRRGQVNDVNVYYLMVRESKDEDVLDAARAAGKLQDQLYAALAA